MRACATGGTFFFFNATKSCTCESYSCCLELLLKKSVFKLQKKNSKKKKFEISIYLKKWKKCAIRVFLETNEKYIWEYFKTVRVRI